MGKHEITWVGKNLSGFSYVKAKSVKEAQIIIKDRMKTEIRELGLKIKGGYRIMNKEQEENIASFTRDIKDFLRQKDFTSALILVDDLKRYIIELEKDN